MRGVELLARREGLGLSKPALAQALSVREQNLARWEHGKNPPRSWDWIVEAIEALEDHQAQLVTQMMQSVLQLQRQGSDPLIITYASQRAFDQWEPAERERSWAGELRGVPVELHRAAAARAALRLRLEHGVRAVLDSVPAAREAV